jgi:ketosteroid isomerase-like protein
MQNNWAKLDQQAYDGIAEYLKHAKDLFPEDGQPIDDEQLEDILAVYAHMIICTHLLLMNSDKKYRDSQEHDLWCKKLGIQNDGDLNVN